MKRMFYSLLIIFLFIGGFIFFATPRVHAVDFCPEIDGKFDPGDVICVGDGTGNRQICQDVSGAWIPYTPSCGHDEGQISNNNGDLCDKANPKVCKAVSTPTPQPTAAAGDADCVVTTIGADAINPPVTMKSGTAKCINNVATTCNNGNKSFINCTDQAGGCAQVNASTATCSGPTPTPKSGGFNGGPTPTQSPGQLIPQPGYNCGMPPGPEVKEGDLVNQCCYSPISTFGDIPTGGIVVPDWANIPVAKEIVTFILGAASTGFNRFPMVIDPYNMSDKMPFTVGNIKKGFASMAVCINGSVQSTKNASDAGCKCIYKEGENPTLDSLAKLCVKITNPGEVEQCIACSKGELSKDGKQQFGGGVWTGLGCINVSENGFIYSAINIGISLGGGFALMCIIYAAFLLQTSGGSPEAIKKARDLMTSCITGLILIIFSVFILRVIGYDILKLPGFGN